MIKYSTVRDWIILTLMIIFIGVYVYSAVEFIERSTSLMKYLQKDSKIDAIWGDIGMACIFMGGSLVGNVLAGWFSSLYATSICRHMRSAFFGKVNNFSFTEIGGFSIPSLITRCTNDVTQIQSTLVMIKMIIQAPAMAIASIAKISVSSGELSIVAAIGLVIVVAAIAFVIIITLPKFRKIQKVTDKMNLVARENITGIRVIRAYGAEQYQTAKFENVNSWSYKINLFVNRAAGTLFPVISLSFTGIVLAIWWFASILAANHTFVGSLKDVTTFVTFAMQILMGILQCIFFFMMLPRAIISYKRFNEVMKTKNEIADPVAPLTFKTKGEIEFKHVTFKYKHADEPVLKNISFKIAKGETVAFIGSTGCGKSSLINLIPRFCDPTDGEILVNNVNIKNVTQESLRHIIGFVPQKTTLFSGTIESNIKYGGDVSDANMIQAAKIAHAYEFVNKLPDKFNSHVSQGASNLSGGQKQRIAIARALALNPEIFIFDDSFSALDYKTDQLVRADIKKYMRDTTNIIVAQRIGTILDADTIYVLEEGKIVGSGSHNNLMRTCPVYKQIALSQLSKTELDKIHKEDAK